MEALVALLDALEDLQRLVLVRRRDVDGLEAAQQRAVLLDVAAVLADGRRADAGDLAARQRRLEDVRGVERALGRAGADQRVDLVDEDDDVGFSFSSLMMPLSRSSNWPRYLVPATISERSSERMRLLAMKSGTLPSTMRCASPSTMAVLPTPGSPRRIGLFFVRRERIWMMRSTSFSRPMSGSNCAECAICRQVARVLGEERQLFLLLVGLALFEDRDRLFAHAVDVEALGGEDARGRRRLDAQDADQQMLGADVLMQHRLRFVRGVREDLLRLLGERQFGGRGDAVDEEAVAFDFAADLFRLDVEAGEDLFDDLLPLAQDAEEDVLGLDDARAELGGFVAGEEECAACFLVVFFEHGR